VTNGGTAIGTSVSGGTEIVSSGGTTSNTLLAGGQETVMRSGHATGTIISSGGYELVSSGGTAVATAISGGTLEVASGGTASGVAFSSSGTLQLDSGSHISGAISGFHSGGTIELRELTYAGTSTASWTQLTSGSSASGTLTVKEGASSVTLTLVGSYTSGNFSVTSDGSGGTLVTDPPVDGGGSLVTSAGTGSDSSMADIAPGSVTVISSSVISGGYELGTSGATAADTNNDGTAGVFFSGGGMVALDALLVQFAGVVSGFDLGDGVDLQSLGFGSSSSAWMPATSGSAAGASGGDKAGLFNLTLLGQYAANFSAAADGHDGTLTTDPSSPASVIAPMTSVTVAHS
jgi:autotransporter passenger strand-loop-strand repeat protein